MGKEAVVLTEDEAVDNSMIEEAEVTVIVDSEVVEIVKIEKTMTLNKMKQTPNQIKKSTTLQITSRRIKATYKLKMTQQVHNKSKKHQLMTQRTTNSSRQMSTK